MTDLPAPYETVRLLGRGGMAAVHLARDTARDVLVAVKVLEPDERGRVPSSAVLQLRDEAGMLSMLRHPAIPALHEVIDTEHVKALVMAYVDGPTLEAMSRSLPPDGATLLDQARQLCDVLAYLHSRRPPVIFRDLKPANVLVDGAGRLVLIDFGIAKVLDEKLRRSTQTTARGMLTRGFAAVEQYVGGTDHRSDIYALGATLYAVASGRTPPESLSLALGRATLDDLRTLRPDLPDALLGAIEAMMALDRGRRPPDIAAVGDLLGFDLAAPPPPVHVAPRPGPSRPPPQVSDGPPTERAADGDVPDWRPPF